ncbi:MAG: bifunctional UDP-sugar hydrolase/5'-nucleotidase [Gammaproteobacteria bacterium]
MLGIAGAPRSGVALALLWLLCMGAVAHAAEPDALVRVTLLHVNDVYQLAPVEKGTRGGLARVAAIRNALRAEVPNTLLMFGGDTLSPSVASRLFEGRQMIAGWNAVGLDYAVPGNHEFDFGSPVFRDRMEESRFVWLAANVRDRGTGKPFGTARRHAVHDFGGVKVGFFGLVTPDTVYSSSPGPDVEFLDPVETAQEVVQELRGQGVRVIVALTHMSLPEDRRLARRVPVDLILGGHEHILLQSLSGRTPIFKMGADATNVGRIDLYLSAATGELRHMDWEVLPVTAEIPEDPAVAALVADYERRLHAKLGETVGHTAVPLDARQANNRREETNLGSFIAETYRKWTQAELALVNGGSIRSNAIYAPGPLSRKDILSILPFENPVVKVEVSGKVVRAALEHGFALVAEQPEAGRFPQIAGMRVVFDASRPPGARVVSVVTDAGPLEDDRMYTLATNEYLRNGGDGYTMLRAARCLLGPEDAQVGSAVVMADITGKTIAPRTDGRIRRLDGMPK